MIKENYNIIIFDILPSTQDYIIHQIKNNKYTKNTIIVAKEQNKGRGRKNNNWITNNGCLMFSIGLERNTINSENNTYLYFLKLIIDTLKLFTIEAHIKWPNDIIINNKKIAGIIIDIINNYIVVGIGININNNNIFYSIEELTNINIEKEEFLNKFINNLIDNYYTNNRDNRDKGSDNNTIDNKYNRDNNNNLKYYNFKRYILYKDNILLIKNIIDDILITENNNKEIIEFNPIEYSYDYNINILYKKL